jgi:transcriptional regulator with XRE-family HTH domain
MERARLSAARHKKHWSLDEAAAQIGVERSTLRRWEKGKTTPQPMHLRKLCEVYGLTAQELDLEEDPDGGVQALVLNESEAEELTAWRSQDLTLRLFRIVWHWPIHNARYHELQQLLLLELEDNNAMTYDELTRRDALRRLALLPIELCGLSAMIPVFKRPNEEILTQCAAGITACWQLRKGKELTFANDAVSSYLPTLKAMVKATTEAERKAAAELLVQCLLLKATLSWHTPNVHDAINYAQQAERYSIVAENLLLQIVALRTQSAAYCNVNSLSQALQTAQKAKHLLGTVQGTSILPLVHSYVYAGLAFYQAYHGYKQDALTSLKKAHATFFAQPGNEATPIWIDHSIGNLLDNDGQTHFHLGLYKEAIDSFTQIHLRHAHNPTVPEACQVASFIAPVMAEVSRDDQPRDMEWCIAHWTEGIERAKSLQSDLRFNEAIIAYQAMCAAWPGERRIKKLREHIVRW